ncbi:MAG: PAS domain S-box protein [Desulfobacterium sp.]|nr:PAS domain S-box protein [Desulfobacterium sp.]
MKQPATIPELEKRVEELTAINQLTNELTVNLSKDSFMDSVYQKVHSILKPDIAMVYSLNSKNLILQGDPSKHNAVVHDAHKQLTVGDCLCGLAAETGQAIFSRDICKDPRCTRNECKDAGLCSFAALPLFFDNTLSGMIGIATTQNRAFEEQKDFLEIVSKNIAMGISIATLYEKLHQSNRKLTGELSKRRKTETAQDKGEAVRDTTGKIVELMGTAQDITQGKKAERLLKEREQVYRSMFDNNNSVMLLVDPATGAIVDANPSACTFYGHGKDQLTGMNITDINILSQAEINTGTDNSGSQEKNYFNFRHRTAGGEIRDVEIYSGPISVSGKPLLCSIIHDISLRKQAEKEREQLIEQLRKNVQEIKTLRGFLPICSSCMKIRDDQGYWNRIESYIEQHSEALFSHGICPACMDKLYGKKEWYINMKAKKKKKLEP